MSLHQSSPALTSAQDIIASGRETIVSPCCPVCQNLDPTETLTERSVVPRSPLGSRGRTLYSDAELLSQWGAGRVALFNREFGELNERRRTGCIYCALLLQACEILGMKGTEINIWLERGQNPKVTVWTRCNKRISFELFTNRDIGALWGRIHKLDEISRHPNGPEAVDFLDRCIQECTSRHTICRSAKSFTPKRLIELRPKEESCRLVEGDNEASLIYTALSHCWGQQVKRLRTISETLEHHKTIIGYDELPNLFRDAILLTLRLKIKYIWIDSLCIIQDDDKDWAEQSAQMAQIYENAYLVIAAGSSAHSGQSFLNTPNRSESQSIPVGQNSDSASALARKIPATGMHETYEGYYSNPDPLDERAWTLQERILATRLVNYSSTELQWMCKTHRTCEGGHRDRSRHHSSIHSIVSPSGAYAFWQETVKEFSHRRLTYAKDKLPALAGVASKIAAATGDEYFAGLWKRNLAWDLCWERHMWEIVRWRATENPRAPSFSWASVEGNVYYHPDTSAGRGGTCHVQIINVDCKPKTFSNPFGEVNEGGFLRLRAPVKEGRIHIHPNAGNGFLWSHELWLNETHWRIPFMADVPLEHHHVNQITQDHSLATESDKYECTAVRAPPDSNGRLVNGERVWLLVVGFWHEKDERTGGLGKIWFSCIILGRRTPDAFERLGFVNTGSPEPYLSQEDCRPLLSFLCGGKDKTELTIV
ncbi:HET-domain-containing protein [Acephala macrosclerotiorum]|nr:HET-domain-containing protein [Acephala macrosclerotiorum]